jgi:hypothetical protein
MRFAHALVVGGSGMLAACSYRLLAISERVTVMARREAKVRAIDPRIEAAICDYNDEASFTVVLARLSTPDLVIGWLHGKLPSQRRALAQSLRVGGRFVQVLGSAHGDPKRPDRLAAMRQAAGDLDISYQAVVLGFVAERGTARWLTDEEISTGVYSAVQSGAAQTIVGTVSPWDARP